MFGIPLRNMKLSQQWIQVLVARLLGLPHRKGRVCSTPDSCSLAGRCVSHRSNVRLPMWDPQELMPMWDAYECAGSWGTAKKSLQKAQPPTSGKLCGCSPVPAAGIGMLRHREMSWGVSTVQDTIQIPYNRTGQVVGETETRRDLGLRYLLPADFSFIFNTQRNRCWEQVSHAVSMWQSWEYNPDPLTPNLRL